MKTPPAEITSGCCPGNPQWPLPALNTTTIPEATAAAIALANAMLAADRGPNLMLDPQEQVMISGPKPTAALKEAIELAKFILTGLRCTSGATEKILADSPVPCPLSSLAALAAPGPRIAVSARYPRWVKNGWRNQPLSTMETTTPLPVTPPLWARSALQPKETSAGTSRCQ